MGKIKSFLKARVRKLLPGNDPDFLIIGVQKAGTSALHFYLDQHPALSGSRPKELHFFENDIARSPAGVRWYRNRFKGIGRKLYFESTPSYLYHEHAAVNIQRLYPHIKLVVVLREPVSRAYSAWNMYREFFERGIAERKLLSTPSGRSLYAHLFENRNVFPSFSETISIEKERMESGRDTEPSILRRGLYCDQIVKYYKYFRKDQFHFVGYAELLSDPGRVCMKILEFLESHDDGWEGPQVRPVNKIEYTSEMSDDDRNMLSAFYDDHNTRLWNLLGYKIDW